MRVELGEGEVIVGGGGGGGGGGVFTPLWKVGANYGLD